MRKFSKAEDCISYIHNRYRNIPRVSDILEQLKYVSRVFFSDISNVARASNGFLCMFSGKPL
jgi:hypothetical protein